MDTPLPLIVPYFSNTLYILFRLLPPPPSGSNWALSVFTTYIKFQFSLKPRTTTNASEARRDFAELTSTVPYVTRFVRAVAIKR